MNICYTICSCQCKTILHKNWAVMAEMWLCHRHRKELDSCFSYTSLAYHTPISIYLEKERGIKPLSSTCTSPYVLHCLTTLVAISEKTPISISSSISCTIHKTLAETTTEYNLDKMMRLSNLPVLVLEVFFRERFLRENFNNPAFKR